MEFKPPSPRNDRRTLLLAAVGLFLVFGGILFHYKSSPKIALLIRHAGADWILYPKPRDGGGLYHSAEISTVFRREFEITKTPSNLHLEIRAMKRWEMTVNGSPVTHVPPPDGNWKNPVPVEVTSTLRPGSNVIEVTVFNSNGPPALWVTGAVSGINISTGTNWDSSLCLAPWHKAMPASTGTEIVRAAPATGAAHPWPSFIKSLPTLSMLALISAVAIFAGRRWADTRPKSIPWLMAGIALLMWIALYIHNLGLLPAQLGFDGNDHLDYVKYIRTHWRIPFANEGWQMYQPPLYYLISAVLSAILNPAGNDGLVAILRAFGCGIGAANFIFVFLSLRLLFPGRPGAQIVGLLLAAFVGENLLISQFVSNESLCGMLASASIWLCLRILKTEDHRPQPYGVLGLVMGAALLAKFTALLIYPLVGFALAARLVRKRKSSPELWLKTIGLTFFTAFLVCGWHYIRVWMHFGSPMVGNWDAASGYNWWMEDGFHLPGYFFHFGTCLDYPWFSGFYGFADGIYSTAWGDGLWDGLTAYADRGPWNFTLMAAGYLLSFVPTCLILAGSVMVVKKTFRRWDDSWLLLAGIAGVTICALALMCLKVPTYGSAKAFYGLVALLPVCALGALAFDGLKRRGLIAMVLGVVLGVWALASYASYWIDGNAVRTHILLGRLYRFYDDVPQARREYARALELEPKNAKAKMLVGSLMTNDAASLAALKDAVGLDPSDAESHSVLARAYYEQGLHTNAFEEDLKAIALAPGLPEHHLQYSEHLFGDGRMNETIVEAARGLDCAPMSAKLHYGIGLALAAEKKSGEAVAHFKVAISMNPNWAEAREEMGKSLSTLGRWQEAITNYSDAVRLAPGNADMVFHLAGAHSAAGNAASAAAMYERVLQLDPDHLTALNNLAWIRAASTDASLRDGPEAVRLANHAGDLTGGKIPRFLGTLAAAYAEAGQFDEAVATVKKAIERARANKEQDLVDINQKLLKIYQTNRAYHEDTPLDSLTDK